LARDVNRRKLQATALVVFGSLCILGVYLTGLAPAQSGGVLVCVKQKKPGKGVMRLPSSGSCRGNERGVFFNQTGPQGPAGTPGGPPGAPGSPGTPGSPGVSGYVTASNPSLPLLTSIVTTTQDVSCGTKTVLGGGYQIETSDATDAGKFVATSSFPLNANTWRVSAHLVPGATAPNPAGTWTLTASATCATVAP
jgi:hypothetical protein